MAISKTDPASGIRLITFNAPERLNAFDYDMYDELFAELRQIRHDSNVRVVILTGAGKGFCSGHYVGGGAGNPSWVAPGMSKLQHNIRTMALLSEIPLLIRQLPQPVIAAVNGAAAGVGYAIALAADIAIAGTSAKFVNAFLSSGTGHELGVSYMLSHAVGTQRAAELLFTRRPVLADEAARIGLVLKTVSDAELLSESLKLAEQIMTTSPLGISMTKQTFYFNQSAPSLAAAIELENRAVHLVQTTEDFKEQNRALSEKRIPDFKNV